VTSPRESTEFTRPPNSCCAIHVTIYFVPQPLCQNRSRISRFRRPTVSNFYAPTNGIIMYRGPNCFIVEYTLLVKCNVTDQCFVNLFMVILVSIATEYGLDDREVGVRVPLGSKIFLLHVVQIGSGAHPAFWALGVLFPGLKGWGVKLVIQLKLVSRSRKCGFIHSFPHTSSWSSV
jgi:hypothetical protein